MRAGRLLSLLLLLQARGRMTAQALTDELEVSVRTIYRDVEALGSSGVPVYADRGPDGGYRLLDGYRTRLTGLTSEEAESLFLTGMPGPAADLGLDGVLAAAELKLMASMPAELRTRAARMRERFHLDAPGWYRDRDETPYLSEVADAVWNCRRITIAYRRWGGHTPVRRVLDPLGLVLKGGLWYVVARAEAPHPSVRTYRVKQIRELEVLAAEFERPAGFDLAEFWTASTERFEEELYRHRAVVRISSAALEELLAEAPGAVARTARAEAGEPGPDGRFRTVVRFEQVEQARAELLALGSGVEVLEPPELRAMLREQARGLAALYAGDEPDGAGRAGDEPDGGPSRAADAADAADGGPSHAVRPRVTP